MRESDCQQENEIQTAYRLNKRMPITSIDHGGGKRRGRIAAECTATIWYPLGMSFLGILVFVFEHIRQLGDICVTAPNRRPAAVAKIVAPKATPKTTQTRNRRVWVASILITAFVPKHAMSPKETKETAVRAGSRAMFPHLRAIVPLPLIALRQTSRSHRRLPSDKFGIRDRHHVWKLSGNPQGQKSLAERTHHHWQILCEIPRPSTQTAIAWQWCEFCVELMGMYQRRPV